MSGQYDNDYSDRNYDPFSDPNNRVVPWEGRNGQYNQKIVNQDSPDYGAHRGYVPDGSGRQFQAGTERFPRE